MSASQQLLRLERPGSSDFDSFWPGPNARIATTLRHFAVDDEEGLQLLIGPRASGKSHLAQASCRRRWEAGRQAAYLPLREAPLDAAMLDSFAASGLIVVDAVEALRAEDELLLLRLVDRVRAAGGKLLVCSRVWPDQLELQTPDLRSRLQWGAMLELKLPDEAGLSAMLAHRAQRLGVHWSPRLGDFLLRRLPRDPRALAGVLDAAYDRAVADGRQLTVPLLREILDPLATHE